MTLVVLAPLFAAVAIALAAAGIRLQQVRQRALIGRVIQPVNGAASPAPSVLFFTGEACTICHIAQRPALDALARQVGDGVRIREIDIARDPEQARSYRVMSLPTTILLDPDGQVTAVNTGFAPLEKLTAQLDLLSTAPVAAA